MSEHVIKCKATLDLAKTIECGQFFHYLKLETGAYAVAQRDKVCTVRQVDYNEIVIECSDETLLYWSDFFGVDVDLLPFEKKLCDYLGNNEIVRAGDGLRLLQQDPWEACVQFIGASQRSVPVIQNSFLLMTRVGGKDLGYDLYSLLPPEQFCRCDFTRSLLGFRKAYVDSMSKAIARDGGDTYLASLRKLPFNEALYALCAYDGIGPKIANCIALYGLRFTQAFPVDIQIDRALNKVNKTSAGFQTAFGMNAGLAQLYLYQWIRR